MSQQLLDKHYASYGGTDSQVAPPKNVAASSQISVIDGTQEILPEPLLEDNPNRFVILPIQYHDIWKMYKDSMALLSKCSLKTRTVSITRWQIPASRAAMRLGSNACSTCRRCAVRHFNVVKRNTQHFIGIQQSTEAKTNLVWKSHSIRQPTKIWL